MEKTMEKTKEMLKCELTEEEIKTAGADLARRHSELEELEDQLKSIKSDFKSRVDAATAEASILARKIQNGYEFRFVECEIQRIYEEQTIQWVRLDTGEIIKSRAMTPEELLASFLDSEGM